MAPHARHMKIGTATLVGLLLIGGSLGLLFVADSPLDIAAIAGGIGVVISGALLGLTVLAARWRAGLARYTTTTMDSVTSAELYADLAAELHGPTASAHGDAAKAV